MSTRDLGTVILTKSITKKDRIEGKILEDGSSVQVGNGTFSSVNDWINDIYVREEMEQEKDEDA